VGDHGIVIAVACVGKFGGSTLAARACGLRWRESAAIGILMNTRGLMELVILNIGRELGVITDAVFAMMVIMALVTTALTTPILNWVYPERPASARRRTAPGAGEEVHRPHSRPDPGAARPLLKLAAASARGCPTNATRCTSAGPSIARPIARLDEARKRTIRARSAAGAPNREVESSRSLCQPRHPKTSLASPRCDRRPAADGFHRPVFGSAIWADGSPRATTGAPPTSRSSSTARPTTIAEENPRPVPRQRARSARARSCGQARKARRRSRSRAARRPRQRGGDDKVLGAKTKSTRSSTSPAGVARARSSRRDPSPVDAVLREAENVDLVIIGVAEELGLESHLFGFRPQRIALECPKSLLIVRKFARSPHDRQRSRHYSLR
jgi:hypothetical protein